jgi:hypothetical protein
MKSPKYIVIFLSLFLTFQPAFSQANKSPNLVDEFEFLIYDHLRGRLDAFLLEVADSPNATGFIVIYGDKTRPISKYHYEILLKEHIVYRKYSLNRFVFLHAKDEEKLRVQFWKGFGNENRPDFESGEWNYQLASNIKPFIFHKKSWIVEDGFETFSTAFYAKFLKANPNLRANLIIHEKSRNEFQKTKGSIEAELVAKNKVPQNQLRFFHVKSNKTDVEFWIVPKNN